MPDKFLGGDSAISVWNTAKSIFGPDKPPPDPFCQRCRKVAGYTRADYAGKEKEWSLLGSLLKMAYFIVEPHIYVAPGHCIECEGFISGLRGHQTELGDGFSLDDQRLHHEAFLRGLEASRRKLIKDRAAEFEQEALVMAATESKKIRLKTRVDEINGRSRMAGTSYSND